MKTKNLYLTLAVIFIFVSVFLSLRLNSKRGELTVLLNQLEEINLANYNSYIPNKLLFMNLSANTASAIPLVNQIGDKKCLLVVFLKKGFCSSCVAGIMPDLVGKLNQFGNYLIVSHTENANILRYLLDERINENIVWYDDYLYGRHNIEYDAELLFVDSENRITGIIPLNYLKIEGLYNDLMMHKLLE